MAEEVVAASESITSARSVSPQRSWSDALPWWGLVLAFLCIAAAVISRKPELVFKAQFWGDEASWFADAYLNGPLHSILLPQAGYLCVASKLAVLPALHVPLLYAPVVFGLFAASVHALMAGYLLTKRLAHIANLQSRMLLCALWVILPNAGEIDSLNNTQWMLAALAVAVLVSSPPKTITWKVFDLISIGLISVTGPFCVLLFPLAIAWWIIRRSNWTIVLACIFAAGSCVQLLTLRHALSPCTPREILNPLLTRLSAGQIFLFGTLNGGNILPHATINTPSVTPLAIFITLAGVGMTAYALRKAPAELKLFIAFAVLVFAASIRRLHCDPGWDWQSMMTVGYAIRYWYIPRLAVLAIFVWIIGQQRPIWGRSAAAAILLIAASAFAHWRYPAWPYQNFRRYAIAFEQAPKGTPISIPVNPPGWKIILVKR
jgi:hypothetical protein